jgi:hypothetical protein
MMRKGVVEKEYKYIYTTNFESHQVQKYLTCNQKMEINS